MKYIILTLTIFICTTSFAKPKLHVLLTVDSNSNIGKAVNIDKRNIKNLFTNITEHFDKSAFYSISASNLTEKNIKAKISSMNIGTDDVVVFYYSGHGDRSKISEDWPVLTPANGNNIEVLSIITTLNAQVPRQVIVIIDACNGSYSPLDGISRDPASSFNSQAISNLFKKYRGSVLITSSKPGFVSYTLKANAGSLFSYWLEVSMKKNLSTPSASWENILQETKTKVHGNNAAQTPKYKLSKL